MKPETENPMVDLYLRLQPETLSLAWAHLAEVEQNPAAPVPKELSHLTTPEWLVCNQSLQYLLHERSMLTTH